MKILNKIIEIINNKFFVYFIIILLAILLASQCHSKTDLKREIVKKEQNIAAADSVINVYKNKDGQTTSEKAVWILTEKELKKQNTELYNMVKNQSGKIISLNNSIISLVQDTTLLHDSIHFISNVIEAENIDGTAWNIPWDFEYKWDEKNYDKFKGHSLIKLDTVNFKVKNLKSQMDFRESNIDLTFGEKIEDGKFNVFVTSKYPGLSVESMKGVFIDPNTNPAIKNLIEKRHWFTGFSISVGITPGYDVFKGGPTVVAGCTMGYTIYQW
jgi:hypothetical protein